MNKENLNKEISRISYLRMSAGLTQAELSKNSGVNIRQIQKYECGEADISNMTLKNAAAIAKALNVGIKDLLQ